MLCGPSGFFVGISILHYIHKFISDLPRVVLRGNTIALYADDCKKAQESLILLRTLNYFQQDVKNLEKWSMLNDMEFNIKKCKIKKIIWNKQPFKMLGLIKRTYRGKNDLKTLRTVTVL